MTAEVTPSRLRVAELAVGAASRAVRERLAACLDGRELKWEQAVELCRVTGPDLEALRAVADELRARQVGDDVGYVVNRNINFTNACVKVCHFCAFSRLQRSAEAYFLDEAEVVRRALEAERYGATEVCIQAGLAPGVDGRIYVDLTRAIRAAAPRLHQHAWSPEEVKYGAHLSRVPVRDYLVELKAAGLGSLPGTSAEVLDDEVRERVAPGRLTTAEWVEIVRTAHELGLPTTSTLMFGHVETDAQRMRHLDLLRSIQRETHGFTEFVPLSFVHYEAPMHVRQLIPGLSAGPTDDDVGRLYALARLMLGAYIPNLQVSWVKQGIDRARELLDWGANDLGGTLMNESISTSAGASHGQFLAPSVLRAAIRRAGRTPVQRDTKYRAIRRFEQAPTVPDAAEPLDAVSDATAVFGSYAQLTSEGGFRRPRLLPQAV